MNCDFVDNVATVDSGGGIYYIAPESSTLSCCRFLGNNAFECGGGFGSSSGVLDVNCCLLNDNQSDGHGAAISLEKGDVNLINCTIVDHDSPENSAIYSFSGNNTNIINCIIRNPLSDQEVFIESSEVFMDHSNVRGGWSGSGNIDSDPLFVSGPNGNYYLSCQLAGQNADSPCINSGKEDAEETCFDTFVSEYCISQFTTRTDLVVDTLTADMGYHYAPPALDHGLNMYLEDHQLVTDDRFKLTYDLHNANADNLNTDVWILLDVYGMYWCYPSWVDLEKGVDFKTVDVSYYSTYSEVVFDFRWPEISGAVEGLRFWGTALTHGTTEIIGNIRSIEWSYL